MIVSVLSMSTDSQRSLCVFRPFVFQPFFVRRFGIVITERGTPLALTIPVDAVSLSSRILPLRHADLFAAEGMQRTTQGASEIM
jgi:hypothetical protein